MLEIDQLAKFEAEKRSVLVPCLHFPIAARNKSAITRFVGTIVKELSAKGADKAFLVSVPVPCKIDLRYPIWEADISGRLHQELQVWVDVNYHSYGAAYRRAFPNEVLNKLVLDHIMNRRVARLKDFKYTRIVPVSRAVNSSSSFSEKWAVAYHSEPHMILSNKENKKQIQYADLCDIVKMLNIMPGGGVMETINIAQKLVDLP